MARITYLTCLTEIFDFDMSFYIQQNVIELNVFVDDASCVEELNPDHELTYVA